MGAAEPPSIALQPSLARQGTSYGATQHILDACANARPELVERRLAELNQTHAGLLRHMLCTDPKGRCPDPSGRSSVNLLLRMRFFQHRNNTEEADQVLLLALFSSPTNFKSGRPIPPLQLMKEIMSCIEAIPRKLREIRPAARFDDIQAVVKELSPRCLQFSGHGDAVKQGALAGALAFELADGLIHLPNPKAFIQLLNKETCPRLECVYLNGRNTLDPLGLAIQQLPHLTVIGWNSVRRIRPRMSFQLGFMMRRGRRCRRMRRRRRAYGPCVMGPPRKSSRRRIHLGDPEKKDPKRGGRMERSAYDSSRKLREFASKLLTRRQSSGATSEEEAPGTSPSGNKPPKTLHVDGRHESDEDSDAVAAPRGRRRICWLNPQLSRQSSAPASSPKPRG